MPPKRDPRRDKAAEIYREHNGQIDLVEIARQLEVPEGTVRGWKSKDNWNGTERLERSNQSERSRPTPHAQSPPLPSADEQIIAAVEENGELTRQQKDFCVYFTRIRNATQAYLKAYGCSYATANVNGPRLLVNARIEEELKELQAIKNAGLGGFCGDDVVELHMRIAFADINEYVRYGVERKPYLHDGRPVYIEDPNDLDENGNPKQKAFAYDANVVWFRNSSEVDGQLIAEVSQGRDGAKIKLLDRQRSLQFLERYFELNPMDRHRKEYENKMLEAKLRAEQEGDGELVDDWVEAVTEGEAFDTE